MIHIALQHYTHLDEGESGGGEGNWGPSQQATHTGQNHEPCPNKRLLGEPNNDQFFFFVF